MIPCVDNQVLDGLSPKAVPLKPEAPWIKKCSFGIKFTDEIYMTDDDRENTPDEEKEYKKKKQRQQERAMEDNVMMPRSISEPITLANNIFYEDKKKTIEEGEEVMEVDQMMSVPDAEKLEQQEAQELMEMLQRRQDGLAEEDYEEMQKANKMAKGDTLDDSQNGSEDDDFDQRYREQSKAYDRLEQINSLKKPIKERRPQAPTNFEEAMKQQIDEFFVDCTTEDSLMAVDDAKMCILSWAEQILGYEPQDDLIIKVFNRMTKDHISKEEMLIHMRVLQQQAGATGLLSRSEDEFHDENVNRQKNPKKKGEKEATGQMSDGEYSYAIEEDFSVGGSEVDANVVDAQKSYQMTSGEFDSSDKQGFADIKASLRQERK